MIRRSLAVAAVAAASAATLVAGAVPASAAPTVVSTGFALRDPVRPRTATGFCVASATESIQIVFTECGFEGESSGFTAVGTGAAAVATFTGLIGEQPKSLCWEGYAVGLLTPAAAPFQGCTVVS